MSSASPNEPGRCALPILRSPKGTFKLLDEEPSISILVLGANTGTRGPGPLVEALSGKLVGKLRVPVTIVPGNLSDEAVDAIG